MKSVTSTFDRLIGGGQTFGCLMGSPFGSAMMSSAFSDAAKIYVPMTHTTIHDGAPLTPVALNIGILILSHCIAV
jgi:hypothetical protein